MPDGLTTQSATPATVPASTLIATIETAADGHIQRVVIGGGDNAIVSNVSASASSVTILAANDDRLGATLYNDSTSACYVKFAATASSTSFSVAMGPGSYLEVPYQHRGIIDGVWVTATGAMRVTEFVS